VKLETKIGRNLRCVLPPAGGSSAPSEIAGQSSKA
jgi:hypothetical protein